MNNPLTRILGNLGNAELLLLEIHRKGMSLPAPFEARMKTIAAWVRTRETIRRLSEEWQAQGPPIEGERVERGEAYR